ncbi:HAD family hydrolase [Streptomyces sp. NRRL F-5123]|uniref:HAD family hydrolase n=1 Tax=Streptomyces sp. NRRL F-5123 TaxID=1463856 RepID=UPI000A4965D0|nr:haloacid dehalogenase-like hydrolase [Streptomyces sp. NRRL F-5123]
MLDLDGTIHPGTVGAAVLRELVRVRAVRDNAAGAALAAVADRGAVRKSFRDTVETVYAHYTAAIDGLPHQVLEEAARRAWQECRAGVFPFVRPVLSAAARRGYVTAVVSGSPEEAVAQAASDLGIAHAYGARAETAEGRCRARLLRAPGRPGQKIRCLHDLGVRQPLDPARSIALGNSMSDAGLLAVVGHPIAFEPDAELAALARCHGWPVVDRTTAERVCLDAMVRCHDAAPSPDGAADVRPQRGPARPPR